MKSKDAYSNKSGLFQLWLLLLLIVAGVLVGSIITALIALTDPAGFMKTPGSIRSAQAISATFTFLFPALGLAWLCSKSPADYLSAGRVPSAKALLLVLAGIFLLNPTISLTNLLNKQLVLPPFLEQLELWMIAKEEEMEKLVNLLLNEQGIVPFVSNLLVIALLAAVTEEFLFRGALQRIIEKWTSNHHIVIWSAAILFSAIHLQFYGFLPRMLLGAYFGYLLYWSKNIWLPVFAHFINNATAVMASQHQDFRENEFVSGDIKSEHLLGFSLVAALTLVLFYIVSRELKKSVGKALPR